MLRVFAAEDPYTYEIKEVDSSKKRIEDFPNWFILRTPENGGAAADWKWARKENPYGQPRFL